MRWTCLRRWGLLTLGVVGFAVIPAGCYRVNVFPSAKNCRPGDPGCTPTTAQDGWADGGGSAGDGAQVSLTDGPDHGAADGQRDGLSDQTRDASSTLRDSSSNARSDLGGDGRRDLLPDGARDGLVPGRRDARTDTFVCGNIEICGNEIDDDCNGLADCFDKACQNAPSCITRKKELCTNGIDDDGNGFVDCKDPACFGDRACVVPGKEICNNNLDDDDDGLVDCKDPDCVADPSCLVTPSTEICDNGKDDNGDGLVDCTDPKCKTFLACLQAACVSDVAFGAIAPSGATVTKTITTDDAMATYSTCAPPGGVARVASFSLGTAADVRMDFTQTAGSAHVVALFRAGVGQTCDQNPVNCQRVGDQASTSQTYNALPAGNYWLIVQSFAGTAGSTTVTLSTSAANASENCSNGKDDDGDGAIDCADLDCASASNCTLCVTDVSLGAIVLGSTAKSATVDTSTSSNRYHPSCAGLSTGNDRVIRFSVKQTVGLTLSWQQTGDHVYGIYRMPTPGTSCDNKQVGCTDMGGRRSGLTNWSFFEPGDYLLMFKARTAGGEGKVTVDMTAFANRGVELCDNNIDDDGDNLADCDDPDCFAVPRCSAPMCILDGDLGDIDIGTRATVHVDLTTATKVFKADCTKGDGRGRAYKVNLLSPMILEFNCTQTGEQVFQISPQLKPLDPCDAHVENCADTSSGGWGCNFGFPDLQPGPYFVLVQAFSSGTEGTVDLTLSGASQRTLEICNNGIDDDGDGAVDCDDRKCANNSACTSVRCKPDKQLGLLAIDGTMISTAMQTSSAGDDQHKSTCTSAPGGADTVVGFTLPGKTDLTIEWAQVGNHALVLYQGDSTPLPCEANTLVTCKATEDARIGKTVLPGLAAGKYYLVIDADSPGSEGGVILQISGLPSP